MDSKNRDIDIARLVFKHMSNQASPEEDAILDGIYNEDSEAAYAARAARRLWDLCEVPPTTSFDVAAAQQRFVAAIDGRTHGDDTLDHLLLDNIPTQSFDADSAFAKFQSQVRAESKILSDHADHPSEASVRRLHVRRFSAVAAILLCVFAAVFLMRQGTTFSTDSSLASVTLDDGSKVVIAPSSRVEVLSERAVRLEGNAFFDVKHDPTAPFTIDLNKSQITVLGTSFTVEKHGAYVEVSLRDGSVKLSDEDEEITIVPGEKAIAVNGKLTKAKVDSPNAYSLINGFLTFDQTPIDQVVKDLMRHYNLSVTSDLKGCTLTASRLDLSSGAEALSRIAKVLEAEVVASKDGYHLKGAACY